MIDNLNAIKKLAKNVWECLKRFVSSFLVTCYKSVVGSYRLDALKTF